jgi:S1-C subfamily serine protease
MQLRESEPYLKLCSDVFGTSTNSAGPLENPESELYDFDMPEAIAADTAAGDIEDDGPSSYLPEEQETMTKIDLEQCSNGIDVIEAPSGENIEQTSDIERPNTPAEEVITRIRTKMRYIEAVLKNAVIEPYQINGQITGLRITGLDKISMAKDLLIKSGDIIHLVNGQLLSSKKRAIKIFKRARKRPIIEVELLRDGKSVTLLYYLSS